VVVERQGLVLATAASREPKPNSTMRGAAIRSHRQSPLGYATTKHSEPPSVRTASGTAYRTTAISGESFTTSPPLCRFRYRRAKLDYLTPLEQGDPLHLPVKSRRNMELNHACHGDRPTVSFDIRREAIEMPKAVRVLAGIPRKKVSRARRHKYDIQVSECRT
jgi:hypothetical protein